MLLLWDFIRLDRVIVKENGGGWGRGVMSEKLHIVHFCMVAWFEKGRDEEKKSKA